MLLQPENQSKKYQTLFNEIDEGRVKIPQFQRNFVWDKEQTAKLIDSLIKGFPIGTFIFWRTREELRCVKNVGNAKLPETPKGDMTSYVLDGQQRITSLYAVKKGLVISKDGKQIDYKDICIDISLDIDTDDEVVGIEPSSRYPSVSVYEVLNGSIIDFLDKFSKEEVKKIEVYQNRLIGYDFSTIVINDYPIDIACEVFTRINTGGKELTLFEIMVAKTYDQDRGFDLSEKYEYLVENEDEKGKDLKSANYDTIPEITVLQCVSACLCQQIRRQDILKLKKKEFIDIWEQVKSALFDAVDYLRSNLRVVVSGLLPYNTLLVPLTYFFFKNKSHVITVRQDKLLTQYFFWATFSNRFSSSVEAKITVDLKRIDEILKGSKPTYLNEEINLNVDVLKVHKFATGDAFCKGILCILSYFEPRSFATNGVVILDNSWLKVSTSKNYHHFFPKSYLKKQGVEEGLANSVLNITIVDAHINKNEIRAKAPSVYMKKFSTSNSKINVAMQTHLIDDLINFGVWDDNYTRFLYQRGQRILQEINERVYPNL